MPGDTFFISPNMIFNKITFYNNLENIYNCILFIDPRWSVVGGCNCFPAKSTLKTLKCQLFTYVDFLYAV